MVVVKLVGGLASQLHKYAVGRALAEKLNTELLLDSSAYSRQVRNDAIRQYRLGLFNIKAREATDEELLRAKGGTNVWAQLASRLLASLGQIHRANAIDLLIRKTLGCPVFEADVTSEDTEYFFEKIPVRENVYIYGEWGVGFRLFEHLRNELHSELMPKAISASAADVSRYISSSNPAVSIHVRRGDYLQSGFHNVCSVEYYIGATKHIQNSDPTARFFVFSDDMEWAKKSLSSALPDNTLYVDGLAPHEDFFLLSKCTHNIISASGFSALAAWANDSKGKVVVSPKIWFNDENVNSRQLQQLPSQWIYM